MFIGTNDSELKNVAGLAQRFVGPNDSELKNVAGVVRRGSLKVVIQVGRCPVVQNRTSKASCAPTDAYKSAISPPLLVTIHVVGKSRLSGLAVIL